MDALIAALSAAKIVAIVRLDAYDRAVEVAQALYAGGITAIEYTLTGRGAFAAIEKVRTAMGDRMLIGVGTALSEADAQGAIAAGSQFIVTPAVRPAVVAARGDESRADARQALGITCSDGCVSLSTSGATCRGGCRRAGWYSYCMWCYDAY